MTYNGFLLGFLFHIYPWRVTIARPARGPEEKNKKQTDYSRSLFEVAEAKFIFKRLPLQPPARVPVRSSLRRRGA